METIRRWRWRLLAIILLGGIAALIQTWRAIRENSQDPVILEAAARYGVDPALVKAVVWRESWFNPNARGRKGEIGLMQIREKTAEEWAAEEHVRLFTHFQMLDPVKNAHAGTWYLRKLLRRYPRTDNPLPYALADYNAGRARVLQWSNSGAAATNSAAFLARMDYPGTRRYVQSVMKRYQHYRPIFPPKNKRLGLLSHRGAGSDTSATTVNHCVTPPTTMFRLSYFYTISYDARPIHYLSREHQSPHFPAVVFGIQTALVFWDSCEKTLRCVGSRRSAQTKGDGAQAGTYVDSGSRRLNFPPELGLSFLAAVGLAICLVSNWTRSSAVAHPIR